MKCFWRKSCFFCYPSTLTLTLLKQANFGEVQQRIPEIGLHRLPCLLALRLLFRISLVLTPKKVALSFFHFHWTGFIFFFFCLLPPPFKPHAVAGNPPLSSIPVRISSLLSRSALRPAFSKYELRGCILFQATCTSDDNYPVDSLQPIGSQTCR